MKMNIKLILASMLIISFAFAEGGSKKKVADLTKLEGRAFGNTSYDGDDKRRVSILLKKIEGEQYNYYAVLMEYLNPWKEKGFIRKFLRPGKGKKGGYLKELLAWSTIVKLVGDQSTGTLAAYPVTVSGNRLIADYSKKIGELEPRIHKRKPVKKSKMKLTIGEREISIYFNKWNNRFLKSSWEDKLQAGPYNPGYKESGTRILYLLSDYDKETKTRTSKFFVDELNGKNLDIRGEYLITNEERGIYLFKDLKPDLSRNSEIVEDKVGVFVDIYNAQPVMNTVELILIDPSDPYNHQMYFEEFGNNN